MNKESLVIIVLVALIVISGVQAFQMMDLKSDLSEGVTAAPAATSKSSAVSSALPSNLDNLPQMVGGC